jgi:NitT/TauT family transport system permease protein
VALTTPPSPDEPGRHTSVTPAAPARRPRRIGHGPVSLVVLPTISIVLLLGLWWGSVWLFEIPEAVLPSPKAVLAAFREQPGILLRHTWDTALETLLGFAMAVLVGWLIAAGLTASHIAYRMVHPLLVAVNAVPKVAVAPLFVLWLGFGIVPKSLLVLTICFFPIVISAASGLASTPPELVELGRSLEAQPWQVYLKIRLPNAMPQLFVGLKVGITLAVIGAVVAEFQGGTDRGLGFVTVTSSGQSLTAQAFVAVILLALLSIVLFYVIACVEWLLLPWARAMHRGS